MGAHSADATFAMPNTFFGSAHTDDVHTVHLDEIYKVVAKAGKRSRAEAKRLREMLKTPCFRHCGITVGDKKLMQSLNHLQNDSSLGEPPMEGDIIFDGAAQHSTDKDGTSKMVIFTDGSATNTDGIRTAEAGWGVWLSDARRPEEDLWRRIADPFACAKAKPFLQVAWIPSHLVEPKNSAARIRHLEAGNTTD